jgi:uncharacterized protein (UPF0548 family)
MFSARRPSPDTIERFVRSSAALPLSYGPPGIVCDQAAGYRFYEAVIRIGHGPSDFERAKAALVAWKQFEIGWVETYPRHKPVVAGTNVAVLIRHLGFWSLNGCRVLYVVGGEEDAGRFGFAYGTLPNHSESGEELFEVYVDSATADVMYRIRATSWPQAVLAAVGHPIARRLQARFRIDSGEAMKRATRI